MEDRVKTILEKEHSKRFRTMCHRNEGLAQQSKSLQEFYDRQKKKSLHNIETREAELQQKIVTLSQERFVNGLVNQLTEIAFSNTDLVNDGTVKTVTSLASVESEDAKVPRYLRIETNPFHPSEMSLGSNATSSLSVTDDTHDEPTENSTNSEEALTSTVIDSEEPKKNEPDQENLKETPLPERKSSSPKRKSSSVSDDAVKRVVDKLTGFYDIDKLKFLTQVMLKTLQNNGRTRCEEKMKLIHNLNKFLNDGDRNAKIPSRKHSLDCLPKIKGNDTFLFLKADRQQELRDEAEKEAKKQSKTLTKPDRSKLALFHHDHKTHSLPSLPDVMIKCPDRAERRPLLTSNMSLNMNHTSTSLHDHKPSTALLDEGESAEFNDLMKIYLKLGHGTGVLKLSDHTSNRATIRAKQRFWLRKDLRKIPVVPKNGVQDLRVVMKNCRYLRFPKDMTQENRL